MMWHDHMAGGLVGTAVLTTALSSSRGLGFTRMDIPFMLGTSVTPDRDKAKWIGFMIHMMNGWLFTFIYFSLFSTLRVNPLWFGPVLGGIHALFVLTVGMATLPAIHPRMATEHHGPDATRLLEPPGFLALHYGKGTPLVTLLSHIFFGAILGFCYTFSGLLGH